MIVADGIAKQFAERTVLHDVTFRVDDGIVALLGPNGAGKTTLLRILTGLAQPTRGRVSIAGHDLASDAVEAKRQFGYQPEHPDLHPALRPIELFELVAAARGVSPADLDAAIARFGIAPLLGRNAGSLSQGQRRLITLVAAVLHRPPVLLLDEPTNALDPHRVAVLKEFLRSSDGPRAALVSTHQLDFVVTVATRFVLLSRGGVVADGSLEDLRAQFDAPNATLEEIVVRSTSPA